MFFSRYAHLRTATDIVRIVEYATRDQAQQAVNTLSNQNLMGRLVYVREVRAIPNPTCSIPLTRVADLC